MTDEDARVHAGPYHHIPCQMKPIVVLFKLAQANPEWL